MLFAVTIFFESLFCERRFTLDLHHSGSFRQPVETVAAPCLNHYYNMSILQWSLGAGAGRWRSGERKKKSLLIWFFLFEAGKGGMTGFEGLPV